MLLIKPIVSSHCQLLATLKMDFTKCGFVIICVFAGLLALSEAQNNNTRPSVTTTKGEVRGWLIQSKATGKLMKVFRGIPYAKPPLKGLRFKDPVPHDNWTTPLDLDEVEQQRSCVQPSGNSFTGEEDCLHINVYTPEDANSSSLLPVMVWIYGGAFLTGSSNSLFYGPDFLVEQNIIYVAMNYRLGALGYLNLGSSDVPGNAGLKDQRLALQWVQTEISKFGGDPSKVTLFGESAGGASVSFHYLAPSSQSLFTNAIAESGNALAEWPFLESGFLERANEFSNNLNCSLVNDKVQLSCLQNRTVAEIIANQNIKYTDNSYLLKLGLSFVPSLEKPSDTAMLTDTPTNLLSNLVASNKSKPLLTGTNKDEGIMLLKGTNIDYYTQIYSTLQFFILEVYRKKKTDAQIASDVEAIKAEYFNNTPPTLSNMKGFIKINTDTLFAVSTAQFARKLGNTKNVYLYSFEFDGDFRIPISGAAKALNISGVAHADELGYLFYRSSLNQTDDSPAKTTLTRMVKMWTNFAKFSNPTPENSTDNVLQNVTWSQISEGSFHYLRIADQLTMSSDNFLEEVVTFWNKIESTSFGTRISYQLHFIILSAVALFLF